MDRSNSNSSVVNDCNMHPSFQWTYRVWYKDAAPYVPAGRAEVVLLCVPWSRKPGYVQSVFCWCDILVCSLSQSTAKSFIMITSRLLLLLLLRFPPGYCTVGLWAQMVPRVWLSAHLLSTDGWLPALCDTSRTLSLNEWEGESQLLRIFFGLKSKISAKCQCELM